ncbi:hypothetical protein A6R68_15968, partial [Neotoma lepida]
TVEIYFFWVSGWFYSVYTPKILEICTYDNKNISFASSSFITKTTFTFDFCNYNILDETVWDLLPLVKLACGGKHRCQALVYFLLAFNIITPISLILASYLFVIAIAITIINI